MGSDALRRSGHPTPCQLLDEGHADDTHRPNETEVKVGGAPVRLRTHRGSTLPRAAAAGQTSVRAGGGETQRPEQTVLELALPPRTEKKPLQSCYCLSQLESPSQVTPSGPRPFIFTACPWVLLSLLISCCLLRGQSSLPLTGTHV